MKTLYLVRHAKSSWDDPDAADHHRPLTPRGEKSAKAVGRYLRDQGASVDLVLCSTAKRASDTVDLLVPKLTPPPSAIEREYGLYLCGEGVLLERIRDVPDTVNSLMLVAHNPDLHALGLSLTVDDGAAHRASLFMKFPTGACAVILFETARWRDVAPASGRLVDWILPRRLLAAAG